MQGGVLKRGNKHTMESIEEEDENQLHLDKFKQYGAVHPPAINEGHTNNADINS